MCTISPLGVSLLRAEAESALPPSFVPIAWHSAWHIVGAHQISVNRMKGSRVYLPWRKVHSDPLSIFWLSWVMCHFIVEL